MPSFTFSEYVEPELALIWDRIAADNVEAADRFLESAYQSFCALAEIPGMGRPRKFSGVRVRNLRSFRINSFDNYIVFYNPSPDGIEIFHVLHGARNIPEILRKK